jgi:hypothetical protein
MNRNQPKRSGVKPVTVATAVAIFGVLAMLLVDHGPWSRPIPQPAQIANYQTTGAAAHAVGAQVTPTEPKADIEPTPPGPKPAQPADPVTR